MKFKLSQILESTILLEGRREDVINKYGEQYTDLVDMFVDVDPSGNNKYLDWMVKMAIGKGTDQDIPTADLVARLVADFHRNLARIKNTDINSYKSYQELKDVVDMQLVDVNQQEDLAHENDIRAVPTFILFNEEEDEIARMSGGSTAEKLKAFINQ